MKIAYPMRVDAVSKPGGDLLQIKHYIASGGSDTIAEDLRFEGTVLTDPRADLSEFDLIHLTNLDRPVELHHFFRAAERLRLPTVLSSIHHSYVEISDYEKRGRGGLVGKISGSLSFQGMEGLRSSVRSLRHPALVKITFENLRSGIRHGQCQVLEGVNQVLVLTDKERTDILQDFHPVNVRRFSTLRNGCELTKPAQQGSCPRDIPVCVVGRIEARKNQIAILKALEALDLKGVFVGNENPNHRAYCDLFKSRIKRSRSSFLGGKSQSEVRDLMLRSAVHVSASWFEVSSLVDLEAYVAGCQIVSSSCGGTREVLEDQANYIDPGSQTSIISGISKALDRAERPPTATPIKMKNWDEITSSLSRIYKSILADAS